MALTIILPDIPVPWAKTFPPLQSRLEFPGGSGRTEELIIPWDRKQQTVEVPKAAWIPVIAEPHTAGLSLPPCGGLFPHDLDQDERLCLRWVQGTAVRILLRLWDAGGELPWFNAERFCREAQQRLNDPWKIDTEWVVKNILDGTFRVTDIRSLPVHDYRLSLGAGLWFTGNPYSSLYEADSLGEIAISLADGFHQIYQLSSHRRWEAAVCGGDAVLLEK